MKLHLAGSGKTQLTAVFSTPSTESADKPVDEDHKPHQEQASDDDLLSSAEKSMGYDPYDTGRFYRSDDDLLSSAEKNMGYDPYDTGRFYRKRA